MAKSSNKVLVQENEALKNAIVKAVAGSHISIAIDQAGLVLDANGQPVLK